MSISRVCSTMQEKEYLLLICVIWMPVAYAVCPKSTPYPCALSAKCYNYEQYCTSEGEVKSCFPHELSANETAILKWCQGPNKNPHPQCTYACNSKFDGRYPISNQDGGPDLKYFVDAICKEPKPHKCPPSAQCYNFEQYCTSGGEVESCFPHEISTNDAAILEWCRKPDSSSNLTHPTCRFACQAVRDRYATSDQVTSPTVNPVINSTSTDSTSCDCQDDQAELKDIKTLIIIVICILVVFIVAVIIWCCVRQRPLNQTGWRRFICWTRDTNSPAEDPLKELNKIETTEASVIKSGNRRKLLAGSASENSPTNAGKSNKNGSGGEEGNQSDLE